MARAFDDRPRRAARFAYNDTISSEFINTGPTTARPYARAVSGHPGLISKACGLFDVRRGDRLYPGVAATDASKRKWMVTLRSLSP